MESDKNLMETINEPFMDKIHFLEENKGFS